MSTVSSGGDAWLFASVKDYDTLGVYELPTACSALCPVSPTRLLCACRDEIVELCAPRNIIEGDYGCSSSLATVDETIGEQTRRLDSLTGDLDVDPVGLITLGSANAFVLQLVCLDSDAQGEPTRLVVVDSTGALSLWRVAPVAEAPSRLHRLDIAGDPIQLDRVAVRCRSAVASMDSRVIVAESDATLALCDLQSGVRERVSLHCPAVAVFHQSALARVVAVLLDGTVVEWRDGTTSVCLLKHPVPHHDGGKSSVSVIACDVIEHTAVVLLHSGALAWSRLDNDSSWSVLPREAFPCHPSRFYDSNDDNNNNNNNGDDDDDVSSCDDDHPNNDGDEWAFDRPSLVHLSPSNPSLISVSRGSAVQLFQASPTATPSEPFQSLFTHRGHDFPDTKGLPLAHLALLAHAWLPPLHSALLVSAASDTSLHIWRPTVLKPE